MGIVRTRQNLWRALLLGLAISMVGAGVYVLPWGHALEQHFGLAWLFRLRGPLPPPTDVILISIDKASADALGIPYDTAQWPRSLHARLVSGLTAAGARSITFDLHFKQPRNEDGEFVAALRAAGNVALLEYLDKDQLASVGDAGNRMPLVLQQRSPPTEGIAAAAAGLAPFTLPKVPDRVASFWTFDENAGSVASLPLVALALYAQDGYAALLQGEGPPPAAIDVSPPTRLYDLVTQRPPARARALLDRLLARHGRGVDDAHALDPLRGLAAALAPPSSRFLNLYGPAQTITTVFYADALDRLASPEQRQRFAGKAVFVGVSSPVQWQLRDEFRTVFSDSETGLDLSGSEILASAFANMLGADSIRPASIDWSLGSLLAWGLLAALVSGLLRPWLAVPALIGLGGLYLAIAVHVFGSHHLWLPLVVPLAVIGPLTLVATLLWQNRVARADLQRIQEVFGHYLPQSTVQRLVDEGQGGLDDRRTVHGVCLITDAQGYTSIAERMPSDQLVDLVNSYLAVIIEQIRIHGGEISDIKGDSVMAFWASREDERAIRAAACQAVLAIDAEMTSWNLGNRYNVVLPTRVGLHCGGMTLARVGAIDHYEHRAVGDIVNTASRLEQLSKQFGTRLLVSDDVIAGVGDAVTRRLGAFTLSGRSRPVVVHELLGWGEAERAEWQETLTVFELARDAYETGDMAAAQNGFERLSRGSGEDPVAVWFLQQLRRSGAADAPI